LSYRHAVEKARYQHLAAWSTQLGNMRASVISKNANGGPPADGMGGIGMGMGGKMAMMGGGGFF
jgi:hypothetical protein